MKAIEGKILTNIFFFLDEKSHYGLRVLFCFDQGYLLFDSVKFVFVKDDGIRQLCNWKEIFHPSLEDKLSIINLREDELTNYFVEFSNNDIFFIYQAIDGMEFWYQDFKIVTKADNIEYDRVKDHMSEDFIEDVELSH